MNFYPYHDFNIVSPLRQEEAEARLYNLLTPDFTNPQKVKYSDHSGAVANGRFEIKKAKVGKSGPIISFSGYILKTNEGSKIEVKVSPTGESLIPVFMFLFVEFLLICSVFINDANASPFWVPLVVGLFGYFLLVVLVKYEIGLYRRILLKALNGKVSLKGDKF